MTADSYYTPARARRWLRAHGIECRLPKPGRRLVIIEPPSLAGRFVVERVEDDAGRQRYLICPVPR